MKFYLSPGEAVQRESDRYRELERNCSEISTLEDLIERWVSAAKLRGLSFGQGTTDICEPIGTPALFVGFDENNEQIGFAEIDLQEVMKLYPINFSIDEIDGTTSEAAQEKWFQKRDRRLRVKMDWNIGHPTVAKSFVVELILSYILSSACIGRAEVMVDKWERFGDEHEYDDGQENPNMNYAVLHLAATDFKQQHTEGEFIGFYL